MDEIRQDRPQIWPIFSGLDAYGWAPEAVFAAVPATSRRNRIDEGLLVRTRVYAFDAACVRLREFFSICLGGCHKYVCASGC